jgi:hypothetical protein
MIERLYLLSRLDMLLAMDEDIPFINLRKSSDKLDGIEVPKKTEKWPIIPEFEAVQDLINNLMKEYDFTHTEEEKELLKVKLQCRIYSTCLIVRSDDSDAVGLRTFHHGGHLKIREASYLNRCNNEYGKNSLRKVRLVKSFRDAVNICQGSLYITILLYYYITDYCSL